MTRWAGMGLLVVSLAFAAGCGKKQDEVVVEEKGASAKGEAAKLQVQRMANEAYPQWQLQSRGGQCPSSLGDLAPYVESPSTKDPWGNELVFVCGASAPEGVPFGVRSNGPDGKEGTPDDVRSW